MQKLMVNLLTLGALTTALMAGENQASQEPDFQNDWHWQQWVSRIEGFYQLNSPLELQWGLRTIQPIWCSSPSFQNTFFVQFESLMQSNEKSFEQGLGYRFLTPCKQWMLGLNTFLDLRYPHSFKRGSVGVDIQNPWITLNSNYYHTFTGQKTLSTIDGITTNAEGLDGADVTLSAPLPFFPWFRAAIGYYHWNGKESQNLDGYKIFGKMNIAGPLTVEGGTSQDNLGHNSFLVARLSFGFPNRKQYSLINNPIAKKAFPRRDLRRKALEPVRRKTRMVTEETQTGSNGIEIGRGT